MLVMLGITEKKSLRVLQHFYEYGPSERTVDIMKVIRRGKYLDVQY
jgi:hypothetical protein